ncbi:MAG TPA: recombinase family protein [Chloroflexota bacterium]|nr:recombinase family protein [Chloroflexota bacterium]
MASLASSQSPDKPRRAAIYCRVSTGKQEEDGTSLQTQEERCRQYVAEHAYTLNDAQVYREVHTGAEIWEREQLTRLRQAIRDHDINVVVAYALDRVSRNQNHIGILVDELERAGVALELVTEDFENSAVGKFIMSAKAFAAEIEREKFRERSLRGRRALAEAGRPVPGPRPRYGYQWTNDRKAHLDEDPRTAPVVKRIFADVLAGKKLRRIAIDLTNERVPTPTGGPIWGNTTIDTIVRERAYTGQLTAFRYVCPKVNGRRQVHLRPDGGIALPEDVATALIPTATFEAVQAILAANKRLASRRNKNPEAALLRNGFLHCGYCDYTLCAYPDAKGTMRYHCYHTTAPARACLGKPSISASLIDTAVWERVTAVLARPELITDQLQRMRGDDPTVFDRASLDRRIDTLTRQRERLVKRLSEIDDDDIAQSVIRDAKALADQIRGLEQERQALVARQANWRQMCSALANLQDWCAEVAARLETLTYEQRRLALQALDVHVTLWRNDHTPRYEITMNVPLDMSTTPGQIVPRTQ